MAKIDEFIKWQELIAQNPGMTIAEQARKVGVSDSLIRDKWSKGIYPKGAITGTMHAIKQESKRTTIAEDRITEQTLVVALRDESIRAKFNQELRQWMDELPPKAFELPILRIKWVMELATVKAEMTSADGEKMDKLKAQAFVLDKLLDQARKEQAFLEERGLPNVVRALVKNWMYIEPKEGSEPKDVLIAMLLAQVRGAEVGEIREIAIKAGITFGVEAIS